ncbi:odorant receptor 33a [Halyomorpha halys]|uniref:odorant receptor 33a n=1 Tax=Halyomorpha halys TaxID=286706 RepID=UPI0006D4CD68|nr:Odorant receptor 129 [Halyomorpha halys]
MEPKQFMLFCLNFSGMVYVNGGSFLKAYVIYQTCAFIIFGTSLILFAYFEPKPLIAKLQTLHFLIALSQIFCKFLSIALNQRETVDILDNLEKLSKEAFTDQKNAEILKRANKSSTKLPKIFMYVFCGYYPLRTINLLIRYLVFKSPQKFVEASWIPPFLASNYLTGLIYQVATCLCTGFTNAAYTGLIIFLTIQLSGQIQILRRAMEDGYPIKECVVLHQKLLRLFFRINRLLNALMLAEYILSSLYSCISTFLILKSLSSGGKGVANNAYVLVLVLLRVFLICYCGNIIQTQGEKLHSSAYFGEWYRKSLPEKKSVQLMMSLTMVQPFKYNYRRILTVDMALFLKSIHTTYSYLTMLLSFADHK